jgi:hypothetical protein
VVEADPDVSGSRPSVLGAVMLSAKRRPVVCEGVGGRIQARCRLICSMDGGLMAVTADLAKLLDKAYEDKTLAELVDAPVSALSGVSEGDAKLLAEAFNVKTIGDLGRNKFFRAATALVDLAGTAK